MKYITVTAPRYTASGTIDMDVEFEGIPGITPFTASPNDVEAHGRELFERAAAGDFGPVAPNTQQ